MWKPEHRIAADRNGLRYPSDLTDAEWVLVEPLIPPARHGGRRRSVSVREVLNGIFYILWTGCQWQALPKDLPPKSTADSGDGGRAFHLKADSESGRSRTAFR
jgi:transposase